MAVKLSCLDDDAQGEQLLTRLLALNAQQAEEERLAGAECGKTGKKGSSQR